MADTDELDTDVDEAEQLIAQLLEAGYAADNPQGGDETGENDEPGDGGADEDAETETDTADEVHTPGDEEAETGDEPDAAQAQEPVAPAPVPGPFDSLTEQEKQALLRVRSLLTENPDIAEGFDKLVKGKFQPEPDKTLPDYIDPEDTAAVKQYEALQEIDARLKSIAAANEAETRQSQQSRVNTEIGAAVDKFKVAHPNLTDEDIAHIREYTAANVNIANVMSNFPDHPVEGIVRSMEIGSMTDPSTRDKVLGVDPKAVQARADDDRKKKLSALSGSTGSGPRTKPQTKKPGSWQEMTKQLVQGIEELGGV